MLLGHFLDPAANVPVNIALQGVFEDNTASDKTVVKPLRHTVKVSSWNHGRRKKKRGTQTTCIPRCSHLNMPFSALDLRLHKILTHFDNICWLLYKLRFSVLCKSCPHLNPFASNYKLLQSLTADYMSLWNQVLKSRPQCETETLNTLPVQCTASTTLHLALPKSLAVETSSLKFSFTQILVHTPYALPWFHNIWT